MKLSHTQKTLVFATYWLGAGLIRPELVASLNV